jgi:hypothetical protein
MVQEIKNIRLLLSKISAYCYQNHNLWFAQAACEVYSRYEQRPL